MRPEAGGGEAERESARSRRRERQMQLYVNYFVVGAMACCVVYVAARLFIA